jgi:hypothetical protein
VKTFGDSRSIETSDDLLIKQLSPTVEDPILCVWDGRLRRVSLTGLRSAIFVAFDGCSMIDMVVCRLAGHHLFFSLNDISRREMLLHQLNRFFAILFAILFAIGKE